MKLRRIAGVRVWLVVAVLPVAAMTVTGCSGGSAAPSAAVSASSTTMPRSAIELIAKATHDAVARGSVRVSSQARQGSKTETFREDAAIDRGRQLIHLGAIHAEVIQVGDRAYVNGNGVATVKYFGLPARAGSRVAGRWILFTPSDPGYQAVITDVTIPSELKDLIPVAPLSSAPATVDGRPVVAITGQPPAAEHPPAGAKETLFISKSAQPLPVRETGTAPGGVTELITFSRWGQRVAVSPPHHSVPISSLTNG